MAIPKLASVTTAKALINAGENGCIDAIDDGLVQIADSAKRLCELMENSLRPGGAWRPWCNANMTAEEKAWYVARYLELKAIRDAIA